MKKTLFQKDYDGESIVDIDRDVSECLDERYNPEASGIPSDAYGFPEGTFRVTVEWVDADTLF